MNNVNKYLKIARNAVIEPSGDVEKKIIDRISHINRTDRSLLDDKFLDFFKKSNSRIYLIAEKIKNNPGAFATLAITLISMVILAVFIVKLFLGEEKPGAGKNQLSSSKNEAQKN